VLVVVEMMVVEEALEVIENHIQLVTLVLIQQVL
jgi:hypothetical protein